MNKTLFSLTASDMHENCPPCIRIFEFWKPLKSILQAHTSCHTTHAFFHDFMTHPKRYFISLPPHFPRHSSSPQHSSFVYFLHIENLRETCTFLVFLVSFCVFHTCESISLKVSRSFSFPFHLHS